MGTYNTRTGELMSKQNRPNLHAVGLLTDILTSVENRVRGKAGLAEKSEVLMLISEEVMSFVEKVDAKLNNKFGR